MTEPIVTVSGAINWDILLYVSMFGRPGEEVPVSKIERVPGGKGANVAVAAARILGKGRCAMVGGIGVDEIGSKHLQVFQEEGVDTTWLTRFEEVESGQAYILVDERGENQINTYFGANIALRRKDADKAKDLLAKTRFLIVIDPPIEFAEALLSLSKEAIRIWSPGVRARSDRNAVVSHFWEINYLILNEHELFDISGSSNVSRFYENLIKDNPMLRVIITQGSRGATLYTPDTTYYEEGIDLRRLGLKVANTTGCGDAFVGAFVSHIALGTSEKRALKMANLAAALKASKYETRGSPMKEELDYYVKSLGWTEPETDI
ncbi:MAG: carbohydrate kinase family protein [Nitrososphaeria archaeon]